MRVLTPLTAVLPSIEPAFSALWPHVKKVVDMDMIDEQEREALEADKADVALDNSIWASKVWKWEKE